MLTRFRARISWLLAVLAFGGLTACKCSPEPAGLSVRTAEPDAGRPAAADGGAQRDLLDVALEAKAAGRLEDARRRFLLLAERGLPAAQHQLGLMLDEGQGGPADPAGAARWLTLAADRGVPEAQLRLGLLHKAGRGLPQDDVKAWLWLSIAAKAGQAEAAAPHLGEIEARLTEAELRKARQMLPLVRNLSKLDLPDKPAAP
ncbi:MAG TPA: tetratricopeptide repeat protein [Myxococcota bacterium]|nr:tetratricopeptide repeat protein [Myxococcota bacterium]HRY93723.1 tetratricopeptide repeat protein [Myxococcota bacterium]HSA21927.1 tetratricopeptide repeat protein [Myxococcota bacterium]